MALPVAFPAVGLAYNHPNDTVDLPTAHPFNTIFSRMGTANAAAGTHDYPIMLLQGLAFALARCNPNNAGELDTMLYGVHAIDLPAMRLRGPCCTAACPQKSRSTRNFWGKDIPMPYCVCTMWPAALPIGGQPSPTTFNCSMQGFRHRINSCTDLSIPSAPAARPQLCPLTQQRAWLRLHARLPHRFCSSLSQQCEQLRRHVQLRSPAASPIDAATPAASLTHTASASLAARFCSNGR